MGETIDGAVTKTSVMTPITSTTQLIQAHQCVAQPARGQPDFFALIQQAYPWFAKKNQVEAQPYLEGACIAREHGIQQQVWLYANMVLKIVTQDRAEWTLHLVEQQIGYKGELYYRPDHESIPTQQFTVPIPPAQTGYTSDRFEWVYIPIGAYATMIPPRALQTLAWVEKQGAPTQAYWVADKVKVQSTRRLKIDPVLCAQYGRWFVSICYWR